MRARRLVVTVAIGLALVGLLVWGVLERERARRAERKAANFRDQVHIICYAASSVIEDDYVTPQSVSAFARSFGHCLYLRSADQRAELSISVEHLRNYDRTHDTVKARKDLVELLRRNLP